MNTKTLLAVLALAAAASTGARADEAEGSQHVLQFEGSRTRAEVQAEAAGLPSGGTTQEHAGAGVLAPRQSGLDAASVRAQAAEAVRTGEISSGEVGLM
ncbi:DUF4148 domain-containing protein [Ramlibacter tataouinensis]|nr:hypothetical protein [Ramlibacter tataouinensis]